VVAAVTKKLSRANCVTGPREIRRSFFIDDQFTIR